MWAGGCGSTARLPKPMQDRERAPMSALNRRQFLAGAAVVVAFDGLSGRWLTAAAADGGSAAAAGLSVPPPGQDAPYLDTVLAVDQVYAAYQAAGWDRLIKPWFDVWLPDETVERYVGAVIPTLTPLDVGATGFVLLIPARRSSLHAPLLRVPGQTDWVYLFDILSSSAGPGPDPAFTQQMLARNRRLFEQARAAGGTRYPIGSIPFNRLDWVRQYGETYAAFAALKRRYDPDGILTPGPGILP
jgi:cytokinin dehydrogenase